MERVVHGACGRPGGGVGASSGTAKGRGLACIVLVSCSCGMVGDVSHLSGMPLGAPPLAYVWYAWAMAVRLQICERLMVAW